MSGFHACVRLGVARRREAVGRERVNQSFLKSLSNALRASSAFFGAGGPGLTAIDGGGAEAPLVPSRATVTRGVKSEQSLFLSLTAMRTGIGFMHWKRVEGSKWEHCLQQ